MSTNWLKPLGVLIVLVLTAPDVWAQDAPGGGFPGRGFGSRGGKGGGGGRGGKWYPGAGFDRFAQGKDVLIRAELDEPGQRFFDFLAGKLGVTNGRITREEFMSSMQEGRLGKGRGPGKGGAPAGAPGTAPGSSGDRGQGQGVGSGPEVPDVAAIVERTFRRLDQNGDGLLNFDEMPDGLRQEKEKWDTNHDGFIDAAEFRAYLQARMERRMAERERGFGREWDGGDAPGQSPPAEEEKRQVIYRPGKMPKNLPAWFNQLDTDKDGQIGLYEWKESGRSLVDFARIDRNGDGFLTAEEVLYYEAHNKASPPNGDGTSPGDSRVASPNSRFRSRDRMPRRPSE